MWSKSPPHPPQLEVLIFIHSPKTAFSTRWKCVIIQWLRRLIGSCLHDHYFKILNHKFAISVTTPSVHTVPTHLNHHIYAICIERQLSCPTSEHKAQNNRIKSPLMRSTQRRSGCFIGSAHYLPYYTENCRKPLHPQSIII